MLYARAIVYIGQKRVKRLAPNAWFLAEPTLGQPRVLLVINENIAVEITQLNEVWFETTAFRWWRIINRVLKPLAGIMLTIKDGIPVVYHIHSHNMYPAVSGIKIHEDGRWVNQYYYTPEIIDLFVSYNRFIYKAVNRYVKPIDFRWLANFLSFYNNRCRACCDIIGHNKLIYLSNEHLFAHVLNREYPSDTFFTAIHEYGYPYNVGLINTTNDLWMYSKRGVRKALREFLLKYLLFDNPLGNWPVSVSVFKKYKTLHV